MKKIGITALMSAALYAGGAQAGPASDMARARIDAIAAGNVETVTAAYAKGAALHWVGGPLDGAYEGEKLREVRSKFSKANGPLQVALSGTLRRQAGRRLLEGLSRRTRVVILSCGAISGVSWYFPFLLGIVRELNFAAPVATFLAAYGAALIVSWLLAQLIGAFGSSGGVPEPAGPQELRA